MGNRNYSIIELYDLYVGRLCREKQPILADNLEKNTGVNLTNMPFALQPLDARHEEINKKGQNMFKGKKVEDFQLALNILDDVHMMRSRMFDYSSLTDRANAKSERVSNYEPLITTMRVGIRASKYYSEPQENKALQSITGKPLNEDFTNLHQIAIQTRDADIRNVIRHRDFRSGFDNKSKMFVLDEEKKMPISIEKKLQLVKNDIKVMIETIEDPAAQLAVLHSYKQNKNEDLEFLENMLQDISNGKYSV